LQKEILDEKETEMLDWLEMFTLKLEEENIISRIKEKSDQQIINEKEILKTKELKARSKEIGEINKLIKVSTKVVEKIQLENNPDIAKIENTIKSQS